MSIKEIKPDVKIYMGPPLHEFHPGPDPDFQFPKREPETPQQKLLRLESELIERELRNPRDHLTRQILVLRAQING